MNTPISIEDWIVNCPSPCYEGCDRAWTDSGTTRDDLYILFVTIKVRKPSWLISNGMYIGISTRWQTGSCLLKSRLSSNLRVLISSPFKRPSSKTWANHPWELRCYQVYKVSYECLRFKVANLNFLLPVSPGNTRILIWNLDPETKVKSLEL